MTFFTFDLFACGEPVRIDLGPPFFGTLDSLAVDDAGGRAGLATRLLAADEIKRVVDALQRAASRLYPR